MQYYSYFGKNYLYQPKEQVNKNVAILNNRQNPLNPAITRLCTIVHIGLFHCQMFGWLAKSVILST